MKREFKEWHIEKERMDTESSRVFFHEREVWWCSLGVNVGFEQDGKGERFARPVLIFKKFSNEVFWAVPLTLQVKTRGKAERFYAPVDLRDGTKRNAILSQLRLVDAKRLIGKSGSVTVDNYEAIQKAIIDLCQ